MKSSSRDLMIIYIISYMCYRHVRVQFNGVREIRKAQCSYTRIRHKQVTFKNTRNGQIIKIYAFPDHKEYIILSYVNGRFVAKEIS